MVSGNRFIAAPVRAVVDKSRAGVSSVGPRRSQCAGSDSAQDDGGIAMDVLITVGATVGLITGIFVFFERVLRSRSGVASAQRPAVAFEDVQAVQAELDALANQLVVPQGASSSKYRHSAVPHVCRALHHG